MDNNKEEFEKAKKELEEKIITDLFNFVKDGSIPKPMETTFMDCYNLIYDLCDKGLGEELLNYHNDKIRLVVTDVYEKLKNLSGLELLNSFISYTERLNNMIHIMARIFLYLSRQYLLEEQNISEFSMDIFKKNLFDKLQNNLFTVVKKLIKEGEKNQDTEIKINYFMKLIEYLDYTRPIIAKKNSTHVVWQETGNNPGPKQYKKMWDEFQG